MGTPQTIHYDKWRPAEARGRTVWVRYKDGDESERPLVLATGAIAIGPQLNPLCDRLEGYPGRVLAMESPGQGRSDRIGRRREIADYAGEIRDIAAPIIGREGLARSVLVGHCLGADAMHALARQEEVAGTVLLNPMPDNTIAGLLRLILRFQLKSAASLLRSAFGAERPDHHHHLKDAFGPIDYNSSLPRYARSVFDVFRVWRSREFGTQAGGSAAVLVSGEYDVQVREADLVRASAAIRNSQVVSIKDSGHMTILARPDAVAEIAVCLASGVKA